MQIQTLDLEYQDTPHAIAAFLVRGPAGPLLIETGPMSTLPALRRRLQECGVAESEIRHVLVTHIHLDHAGAAGWCAQQGATVYVHPVGAPHLVDPSKLLASAERIYGDDMDRLWGRTVPAPRERVIEVEDNEVLPIQGLEIRALATPGHARHHHVYRIGDIAFTGDAAGIRMPGEEWLELPAPPPEFEREVWQETLARLRAERFRTIYRTHFGPSSDVDAELERFAGVVDQAAAYVRELLGEGLERASMIERYNDWMKGLARQAGVSEADAHAYEVANPRDMSVDGIRRYWAKRGVA